ncbi:hypothetical protein JG687_00003979 [Phytophthora cactorum]|uniref:Armadillo-type fold n=1 Tax=Phytophthora cactorum TaxID=29920 RepID=A0A329T359_9STRA|nr:hypothetical protein Pcac1_g23759 [Phytophthora cactorum]KAG2835558.1 hypothetical protein PC111_g5382 [Phytophthora cactorum]KAG2866517.1 hypothetical protein PC113_g2810 [Phytophthora cactorum]KAG2931845.1 hypothetical protein PC115_g6007 [Phytophthora cactorum]KAG2989849.1 hypothetical protein PC118_g5939 [Phytophthora cactorum]
MRLGTKQQKAAAINALERLVRSIYGDSTDVKHENGIAPLVALALVGSEEQKKSAARLLRNVANSKANCAKIASLIPLLCLGSDELKEGALCALIALTYDDNTACVEFGREGGIVPLIDLLRTGTEKQKKNTAVVIRNLARNDGLCIGSEGGIEPLVVLLRTGSVEQKEVSVAALEKLARESEANCKEISLRGGVVSLISLLRVGNGEQKENVVGILKHLSYGDDKTCAEIESEGGVALLVALLQTATDALKGKIVCTLGSVGSNDTLRAAIDREGGIAPLVLLLRDGTPALRQITASAIENLAKDSTTIRAQIYGKTASMRLLRYFVLAQMMKREPLRVRS